MSRPPVLTNRCCKLVSDHFPIRAGAERPSMFDNDDFIRCPLLLRVDTHIVRFAGYSQSSGSADLLSAREMSAVYIHTPHAHFLWLPRRLLSAWSGVRAWTF